MKKIKIMYRVLSRREYGRMPWELRAAHTHAARELTKEALRDIERSGCASIVSISAGTRHFPEHWHLEPIIAVLRSGGWIDDEARFLFAKSPLFGEIEIEMQYED